MGCQTSSQSKLAHAPERASKSQSPVKTLLEGPDAAKARDDAKSPVAPPPATAPEASPAQFPPTARSDSQQTPHTVSPQVSVADDNDLGSDAPKPVNVNGTSLANTTPSYGSGWLRKQRTVCTESNELDVMVVEFSSHDSTVGSVIGRNCKEMNWKVVCDLHAEPIDIKLNVQEHKLHHNEVSIESNGQYLLHGSGSHTKTKMTEDFHFQWPFRARMRGIDEVGFFEFHPPHMSSEVWFPAVITAQRSDGYFEVRAKETDASGRPYEMTYPAVRREDLRESHSKKPVAIPENRLTLDVPKQDPLRATLRMANGELVTHHFGRPSPARGVPEAKLKVSKDRTLVTANVGHGVLSHFVSGEVQAAHSEAERLRHSWTVQVGPFAEHKIEVMKKYTLGKIVTLLVDGEVLVEASAADIGCEGSEWHCKFRFVGERILDFEVNKTNIDGTALDETDHVKERRKYTHECVVVIPNEWDFHSASLFVDGTNFHELPLKLQHHDESNLSMDPMALLHSYGISTPYKVDPNAASNIMVLAKRVMGNAEVAGGFFARCCNCSSAVKDDELQLAEPILKDDEQQ